MVTKEVIPYIEEALGFKLYEKQVRYLLGERNIIFDRAAGYTTVHAINLILDIRKPPLNIQEPYWFSDWGNGTKVYSEWYLNNVFIPIRNKLKANRFEVRQIYDNSGVIID